MAEALAKEHRLMAAPFKLLLPPLVFLVGINS
jgi:hypothetical protein